MGTAEQQPSMEMSTTKDDKIVSTQDGLRVTSRQQENPLHSLQVGAEEGSVKVNSKNSISSALSSMESMELDDDSEKYKIAKRNHWLRIVGCLAASLVVLLINPVSREMRCLAVATLVIFGWIVEALPLGVTAMIPLFAMPLFQVVSAKDIAKSFGNATLFMFLGSLIVGHAIEKVNLHKRVALWILSVFAGSPRGTIGGFMVACALLSA